MRNIRIDLCYEGTRYKGWQRLPTSSQTIQGKLEQTLSRILQEPIEIIGCGRTDAGTHARFYTANFHCSSAMDCQELYMELCRYLPEDIGIYSVRNVSERFHARLNAKTKTYRYRVWQSEKPCVFERKYVLIDRRAVDIDAIQAAADLLEGTHDFSAFCKLLFASSKLLPFSFAPYPAARTAEIISSLVASPETVIIPERRLTEQPLTAGSAETALSTLAEHAAQLIPVTIKVFIYIKSPKAPRSA